MTNELDDSTNTKQDNKQMPQRMQRQRSMVEWVRLAMTYNPGDALFGKGRREMRGDTGAVGAVSNDLRGNNGDAVADDNV